MNKVILSGNLGADAELRHTASGIAVANFRMATTERWKDTNGNPVESTTWHRIVVWGRAAENLRQYLTKGRHVLVDGRLQNREWQDLDGITRRTAEIVAQRIELTPTGKASPAAISPPSELEVPPITEEPAPPDSTQAEPIPL
jgi:single-strand DNA-binding protein